MEHVCSDCVFVANHESIIASVAIAKKARRNGNQPVFINFFTLPNWVGHAAFYAFRCNCCNCLSVDYPHGYTGPGYLYLTCQNCDNNFVLDSSRYAEIYKRDGMQAPEPLFRAFLKYIKFLFKMLKYQMDKSKT